MGPCRWRIPSDNPERPLADDATVCNTEHAPSAPNPNSRPVRLTVETGPLAGTVVHLERDQPALLGSGPDCALRIQEAGVLDQHAVVKALKGQGFGIKALGNVRVNGSEVQASPLGDGDVIEVGTTRIAFGKTQERGLPKISGYRIIDVLGKGGMGTVYRAEQVSLHRQVALKVLKQEQTSDPKFVANFVAEARAAAKLQHPNVVSVFDVEHDGGTYYYAMELMHDGSCEDWLKQNGVMPVDRALQVIADAAAGLAYAESLGMVHRDIKPDNLMLDQHGAIKIADLGLASTSGDGSSEERAIGTPHFMAPEQVLNKDLDHRTDLYALGCTFYRLVTGKTPFRGQTVKDILRAQVKEQAEPASRANANVPMEVTAIIQRLMAKDPGDRYQTANELLEELEAMLQPPQKRGMWIGLAAAAVVIAGGAIWWAVTRPDTIKTIKETVVYDDPEKQEFADLIKVLEGEAAHKDARIALLSARVSGMSGEELANELDRVARDHTGTPAAGDATSLAVSIRSELEQQKQRQTQRRTRIAEHIANVRRSTIKPLNAADFALAIRALDVKPPVELAGDAELVAAVDKLRTEIVDKARDRIEALRKPLAEARSADDETKLKAAIDELEVGLKPDARWPQDVASELAAAKTEASTGREALAAVQQLRRAGVWKSYHELLRTEDGFRSHIGRYDFQAAADSVASFGASFANGSEGGAGASSKEAADRAKGLSEWAAVASAFATALEQACATGQVQVPISGETLRVVRWNREKRTFSVKGISRSRSKEREIDCKSLRVEDWLSLANAVDGQMPGARECFVGLVAVHAHCEAAKTYLANLSKSGDASGDASGTGDQSYPFAADVFESLLSNLSADSSAAGSPATNTLTSRVLSDELQAGKRLAAGLRALSEKRNLAAAGHIEKLLEDHPHSIAVAVMP